MADIEPIPEPDEPLSEALRELIRDAHSENTRKAYRSDLRAFRAWGGSIPTTPRELADNIADEGVRLQPSTITRRLAALSAAHKLSGGIGTPTQHPIVKAALRGLRRQHGGSQRQAAPLMLEDLWSILDRTGDDVRDQRDRALLLVGFAGGLRRSEIVGLPFSTCSASTSRATSLGTK